VQVADTDRDLFGSQCGAPPVPLALTVEDAVSSCNRHSSYGENPLNSEVS
jgi:hypothetical protein